MPTPREAMRVCVGYGEPRLVKVFSGLDMTGVMKLFCDGMVARFQTEPLSGFVFKSRSPSCALRDLPLFDEKGVMLSEDGTGLFARALTESFPAIPVEDELALADPVVMGQFVRRVLDYSRGVIKAGR